MNASTVKVAIASVAPIPLAYATEPFWIALGGDINTGIVVGYAALLAAILLRMEPQR